jgi:hypothetical protein
MIVGWKKVPPGTAAKLGSHLAGFGYPLYFRQICARLSQNCGAEAGGRIVDNPRSVSPE